MRSAAILATWVWVLPQLAWAEETKIGYVDVQRALNEVEDGREARGRLKSEFDEKQKALDERQQDLQGLKEELDKQQMMLSPETKQEKLNELQRKMLEIQQLYFNLQKELSSKEAEMTRPIFERMNGVLNQIAEEQNYGIILEKNESSILFARPHMDLTNELIRKYNDALKNKKKAAAASSTPKKKKADGAPPAAQP
jgi:outer membrane protein